MKLIQHHFIWNEIADDVCVYIIMCLICQSKAIHCHWSYDQLKSLSISKNTWNLLFKEISLDWITGLSLSMKTKNDQKYNSILTVVCHITKYALFILTQNDTTATDFMKLFFKHVEYHFDFLRSIMTDRNSHITSDFWQEVCKIQMIKQHLSITYYSQTDSQSKALNQIIKNYLRAYTSENQTVWAKLLSLVQFAYNNSHNHIIQMSLNRLLYKFNCEIHIDITDNIIKRRILAVKDHIKKLHKLQQKLCLWLVKAQEQMITYYNTHHILKQFKIRNLIKLFIKNLKLKCQKLSSYWINLFRMLEQINEQTYRLMLFTKYVCLHSVFSIQLLEDYHCYHNNTELIIMSDLKDLQNK